MPQEDSFASLFEADTKKSDVRRNLPRPGETIEAIVVQVGKETVFVELDGKTPAFIEASEVRLEDGTIPINVGDKLRARVVRVDHETGEVQLSRSASASGVGVAALEQARAAGLAVDGKVAAANKGGYEIDLGGNLRGFCPMSQIGERVTDPQSVVGRTLQFLVSDIRENGRNIVLSRRSLVARDAKEASSRLLADLKPGSTVRGTVTGVRDFGAFVDLGGIEGLIPTSELSYDRSAKAAVSAGDTVTVLIRDVKEVTGKTGQQEVRITLSLKALMQDPWDDIETLIAPGKVAIGTVTRIAEFGAFVRLAAGIEGLLHISEMATSSAKLEPGAQVNVVVREIDREKRKLSLVPAPAGLSLGATVNTPKLGVGSIVHGTVERIEIYGLFLQLDGTAGRAGRGLVPNQELGLPRGTDMRKRFPEGTKLKAKVIEVSDGKIKLSVKAALDDEERAQFETVRDQGSANKTLGTFGDLFKKKQK